MLLGCIIDPCVGTHSCCISLVSSIGTGQWYTLNCLLPIFYVAEGGEVYAWGLNQHGQCGVGQPDKFSLRNEDLKLSPSNEWILNVYVPLRVKGLPPVYEVHCGWSHTIAMTTGTDTLSNCTLAFNHHA